MSQTALRLNQSRLTAAFVGGRAATNGTQVFLYVADCIEPTLCLELHSRNGRRIGCAVLEFLHEEVTGTLRKGLYELTQLLSADSPCPGPVAVLSGVLWNRLEVLEQSLAASPFLPQEPALPELSGPQSAAGGFPHEI